MPLTISIADLRRHKACDFNERIADLRRILPDVRDDDPVPLRTWWRLPTTTVPDRFWSLRAVSDAMVGRVLSVRVACLAARRVLRLTRERDRAVCLAAIEAAEAWATGPTVERAVAAGAAARRAAA